MFTVIGGSGIFPCFLNIQFPVSWPLPTWHLWFFFFFASKSDSYSNKKKDKISIPWLPSLTPPSASRVDPCLGLPSVIFDFTLALARWRLKPRWMAKKKDENIFIVEVCQCSIALWFHQLESALSQRLTRQVVANWPDHTHTHMVFTLARRTCERPSDVHRAFRCF